MELRTDGVHCRQSAGTGPVNLKVVPSAALAVHHGSMNVRLSFTTPTTGMKLIYMFRVLEIIVDTWKQKKLTRNRIFGTKVAK